MIEKILKETYVREFHGIEKFETMDYIPLSAVEKK